MTSFIRDVSKDVIVELSNNTFEGTIILEPDEFSIDGLSSYVGMSPFIIGDSLSLDILQDTQLYLEFTEDYGGYWVLTDMYFMCNGQKDYAKPINSNTAYYLKISGLFTVSYVTIDSECVDGNNGFIINEGREDEIEIGSMVETGVSAYMSWTDPTA